MPIVEPEVTLGPGDYRCERMEVAGQACGCMWLCCLWSVLLPVVNNVRTCVCIVRAHADTLLLLLLLPCASLLACSIEETAFWSERVYSHVFRVRHAACSSAAATPCMHHSARRLCWHTALADALP